MSIRLLIIKAGVVFPECGIAWLEDELDSLPVRGQDPFFVRPEDADYIREVLLPYLNALHILLHNFLHTS